MRGGGGTIKTITAKVQGGWGWGGGLFPRESRQTERRLRETGRPCLFTDSETYFTTLRSVCTDRPSESKVVVFGACLDSTPSEVATTCVRLFTFAVGEDTLPLRALGSCPTLFTFRGPRRK